MSTPNTAGPDGARGDLMVVIDHHGAKIYQLETGEREPAAPKPHDPHGFLHHLTHKDQGKERGQRAAEDPAFYDAIAHAVAQADRIVVAGHGKGHSDAGHHLVAYLQAHRRDIAAKIVAELHVDLSAATVPQLLAQGRSAVEALPASHGGSVS